jgi:predicted glycosyltransferase
MQSVSEHNDATARFDADPRLLLPRMDSNERLRQRVMRLSKLGISHKVLAAKIGMRPSTFSRWLNRKPGINPASVLALDGLNAYVRELRATLDEDASSEIELPQSRKRAGSSRS